MVSWVPGEGFVPEEKPEEVEPVGDDGAETATVSLEPFNPCRPDIDGSFVVAIGTVGSGAGDARSGLSAMERFIGW